MAYYTTDNDANKLSQMWIAFGQGTGGMKVDASAVDAAFTKYQDKLQDIFQSWNEYGEEFIAYARAGEKSALLAKAEGSQFITEAIIIAAGAAVLMPCPACPI